MKALLFYFFSLLIAPPGAEAQLSSDSLFLNITHEFYNCRRVESYNAELDGKKVCRYHVKCDTRTYLTGVRGPRDVERMVNCWPIRQRMCPSAQHCVDHYIRAASKIKVIEPQETRPQVQPKTTKPQQTKPFSNSQ